MRPIESFPRTLTTLLGVAALTAFAVGCESGQDTPAPSACEALSCNTAACETCVVDGAAARCMSLCGPGLTCEAGQCLAATETSCDPGCGPCQVCDTTGSKPTCVSSCGENAACRAGVCVGTSTTPPATAACDPACGPCEACDISSGTPMCTTTCGSSETCIGEGVCVRADFHANLEELQASFPDGPSVTAACIGCHQDAADEMAASPHWLWTGHTPNLQGHEGSTEIGKKNLVNNFCVSVPGNEKRCSQCHAGYGMENANFDFDDVTKMDCLICHADPASGYAKAPKTAGRPVDGLDLGAVARTVGRSEIANCGGCHFNAGGGDNVKKGDIGSALVRADVQTDAHMGRGMACADCHVDRDHQILGQGVHTPVSQGRFGCEDCHGAAPHALSVYDEHAQDIACQTCHIPTYSRQQPTKISWDWSTAGDKTRGNGGIETAALADGTQVQSYNFMKGDFVWGKGVKPTYAWYDGRVSHLTLQDRYPEGQGTPDNPIMLSAPLAVKSDGGAKIFPFKVMRGRQPVATSRRLVLAPKLFGPGGFWPQIPAPEAFTPAAVRSLWTQTLTTGARLAGQLGPDETLTDAEWDFRSTEMYLGLNHEIAPKGDALGQPPCAGCHFEADFPWTELGYTCDPIRDPATCGSRHYDQGTGGS